MSNINMQKFIESHETWKNTLKKLLEQSIKSNIKVDPDVIEQDNNCLFGKWLHSKENEKYLENSDFTTIQLIHIRFRKCAADIVRTFNAGNIEEAEELFQNGCFAKTSAKIIEALEKLKQKL